MLSHSLILGWVLFTVFFLPIGSLKVQFYDGDNIILIRQGIKTKLHLACIDAPEIQQIAGQRSRKALKQMIDGKPFQYRVINKDRYGRLLAEIKVGGLNVNRQMVLQGHAFYRNPSDKGCEGFAEAEAEAKKNHRGVWQNQLLKELPPQTFRQSQRKSNSKIIPLN